MGNISQNHSLKKYETNFIKKENYFIKSLISVYYPFTQSELKLYCDDFFWENVDSNGYLDDGYCYYANLNRCEWIGFEGGIVLNRKINWDLDLILYFKDYIRDHVFQLFRNPKISSNKQLVKQLNNAIYTGLFDNENNSYSNPIDRQKIKGYDLMIFDFQDDEIIDMDSWEKFDWDCFSLNEMFPWSIEFLEMHKNRLNWHNLSFNKSLPWNIELLEKFESFWNWKDLSKNKGIAWDYTIIKKFVNSNRKGLIIFSSEELESSLYLTNSDPHSYDEEDGKASYSNPDFGGIDCLINTSTFYQLLPNSLYKSAGKNIWDGQKFITKDIVVRRKWTGFSYNRNLNWSIGFIEEYKNMWDWKVLSSNPSLPWSLELLEKFENNWYWDRLSDNNSVKWDIEMINHYEDRLRFGTVEKELDYDYSDSTYGLDNNPNIIFDRHLIEKYDDKWNWKYLSVNPSINWDINLFNKYRTRLKFGPYLLTPYYENLYKKLVIPLIEKIGIQAFIID